ncbi:hypothetical protein BDV93DRAFT_529377 [Ceratobasidium sp. AG-I]|nr:hypothetical protein BDV93DRAFT_529377 [Ceratobasidium sp. AG-I]
MDLVNITWNNHSRARVHIIVLFGPFIPSLNTITFSKTEVQGQKHMRETFQYQSKNHTTILVPISNYMGLTLPDFNHLCYLIEDLQLYIDKVLIPDQSYSFSAMHFFRISEGLPSIAAQWDAGAIRTICQRLNITKFWIVPLAPNPQEWLNVQALKLDSNFRNSTDYDVWSRHLPPTGCSSFSELLAIDSKNLPSEWKHPQCWPNAVECSEIINQYARYLIEGEQRKRNQLQDALQISQNHVHQETQALNLAKQDLEAANLRYHSLIQHLHLEDNTEEREIIRRFRDLNSLIDELSIDLSLTTPGGNLEQPPAGLSCFNRIKAEESLKDNDLNGRLLALPHAGDLVPTNEVLGTVFGSIVCQDLHSQIFSPFYPLQGLQAGTPDLSPVYRGIRQQFPQMQAAKWRVDTLSVLMDMDAEKHTRVWEMASRCKEKLCTTFRHLTGDEGELVLDSRLEKIFRDAWDLNYHIKMKATQSGDYQTEYFPCNHPYDEDLMQVLDAESGDQAPSSVVLTCGLGLKVTKAIGAQRDPQSKVILKATVTGYGSREAAPHASVQIIAVA